MKKYFGDFITMDNFIAIAIVMAVLVKKTNLATTVKMKKHLGDFINMDNFIVTAIFMAVLVKKTKLATTIIKILFSFSNNRFIIKDRNL